MMDGFGGNSTANSNEALQVVNGPAGNAEMSVKRLARLRAAMVDMKVDWFFMRDTSSIAWLTAFDGVFDEERAHAVLVGPETADFHTDSRYAQACRIAGAGGPFEISDKAMNHGKWIAGVLKDRAASADDGSASADDHPAPADDHPAPADDSASSGSASLGIERSMSLGEFRLLQKEIATTNLQIAIKETTNVATNLRAVKDPDEVARMRAAQAITDAAFSHIVSFMKPGMTEREVQIELEDYMIRHGAAGLAFASIVATGADGASPHAIADTTKLEAGQCVVLDFGARAQGYCSDMTRTVFVGQPDARLADAYKVLRQANESVEAYLHAGITGAQAHQMAEDVLAAGGFGGKMGHALGHGVGIDIHESPVLAPRNTQPLEVGNVVTVEPGIYLDGDFGMRLEDFGVITERGFDVFTQSTHDMVII